MRSACVVSLVIIGQFNATIDFIINKLLPRTIALKLIRRNVLSMYDLFSKLPIEELRKRSNEYLFDADKRPDRD